ncbi:hypothetical protein SAMN03159408_07166, partial [Burkholderia sp. NFPP32]
PGESDCVVLYLPGQGLKQFKSVEEMKKDVKFSPSLLPEQDQADSLSNEGYDLGGFKDVPHGKNFFEHSVEQQVDKQGRDTEYRMAQAHERGVDLTELDQIAGASSDDLRESFDADGPLKERDLRLIEENRPEWWKKSLQEDRAALGDYQEVADQDAVKLQVLESQIPTLEEHTADAIRKEWGEKYPGMDPDEVEVEVKFRLNQEGPNRLNPNPKPQFEIKKVTLTQYVAIGRKLAQAQTVDDTGIAGLIFDRLPGTSIARSLRKVEVSAKIKDENGDVVETLHASDLNALARKLNVGKSYESLVSEKYPALREPWKDAYKSQMKADFQEAKMRGDLLPENERIRYQWVQAVLDNPDSATRQKVGADTVQTDELTVDLRGPNSLRSIRDIFPVSGVLVISAATSHGKGPVVVYTPHPPAGEPAFHLFDNREAVSRAAIFKKPEWIEYFKARIADISVPKIKGKGTDMTRYDAFDLHANPSVRSGYSTFLTTRDLKAGDFTEGMYDSEFDRIKGNADAFTVTNEEVRRAEADKRQGVILGTWDEIRNFVLIGRNFSTLPQITSRANVRKILDRTPKGQHFFRKTDGVTGVVRDNASFSTAGPSLKGWEISSVKHLKYNKDDDIYWDGANNQYIRIGNKIYRSHFLYDGSGTRERAIFRHSNIREHVHVERVGDKWVVLPFIRTFGGARLVLPKSSEIEWPTDTQQVMTEKFWNDRLGRGYTDYATNKNFWDQYYPKGHKDSGRNLMTVVRMADETLKRIASAGREVGPGYQPLVLYRGMKRTEFEALQKWNKKRAESESFIREWTPEVPSKTGKTDEVQFNEALAKKLNERKDENNGKDPEPVIMPIRKHVGDLDQAKGYATKDDEVIVKIVLKPGAERVMFNPTYMAIAGSGKDGRGIALSQGGESYFPRGNKHEGALPGYIGVKSESRGPFSLSLGGDTKTQKPNAATSALFQLFVDKVEEAPK